MWNKSEYVFHEAHLSDEKPTFKKVLNFSSFVKFTYLHKNTGFISLI